MWGNIILEANFLKNYNFSFMYNSSDVVISLLHWQYWWWFWFSFLISLYYLIMLKYVFSRGLKFNPKIVTSYRTHGKWGDVIVCLLPVSWCLNILSNSTTLLKIIEWQSEAAVVTIRIRGKQWYWVYKTDIKDLSNLVTSSLLNSKVGDSFISGYYSNSDVLLHKHNIFNTAINGLKVSYMDINDSVLDLDQYDTSAHSGYIANKKNKYINFAVTKLTFNIDSILNNSSNYVNSNTVNFFSNRSASKKKYLYFTGINCFNDYSLNLDFVNFYRKFNFPKYSVLTQKPIDNWVKENELNYNNFFNYDIFYNYNSYNNFRLLRVNKVLSLPSDIFINAITNSFDVIHSWFIPGLGFKMDCVPGRSTHHSLYLDLPGLYYGQCAEICGRLHHHMPIKLCVLMFDQFMSLYVFSNSNVSLLNGVRESKRSF